MRRPNRLIPLTFTLALAAAGSLAAQAQAAETFKLDLADMKNADIKQPNGTYTPRPPADAPASSSVLVAGQHYIITVKGTGSIWEPSAFTDNGTCGVAESSPMELSPGRPNAVAAWDAATVFAAPKGALISPLGEACSNPAVNTPPLSSTGAKHLVAGFEFSLNDAKYLRPDPIGGARATPRADHTYSWDVVGAGVPARFRFSDNLSTDNSGVLTIVVRGAGESDVPAVIDAAQTKNDQVAPTGSGSGGGSGSGSGTGSGSTLPTAAAQSVKVSGKRTCSGSPRTVTIRLSEPKGTDFAKATVYFNSKKQRVLYRTTKRADRRLIYTSGKRLGQIRPLVFTKLPSKAGQIKLRIAITTTRGQSLNVTRTIKACSKAKPRTVTFK